MTDTPAPAGHVTTSGGPPMDFDPLDWLPIAAYVDEIEDDGTVRLLSCSARYEELTGLAPRDLADDAWSWDDHIHPDDLDGYTTSFEALWRRGEDQDVTYRLQRPDGSWVWLRDRAAAARDDDRGVTVISGYLVDVTRRCEAEAEAAVARAALEETVAARTRELEQSVRRLEESEAGLEKAQSLSGTGSFEWIAATGEMRGSAGLSRIYGVAPAQGFDIDTYLSRIHPDDSAELLAALEGLAAGAPCPHLDHRIVRDGETREVEVDFAVTRGPDGAVQRVHGSVRDVTERRRAERQAEQHTELLRLLAGISARFITLSAEGIDTAVESVLADLGRHVEVDRAYVFLTDARTDTTSNTHEWCAQGIPSMRARLQGLPRERFAWWMERLEADEPIRLDDAATLPPSAVPERSSFHDQGIKSLVVVPMRTAERVTGYLGIDAVARRRTWTDDTVFLLRTVADTLAGALERAAMEAALRRSEANHRTLSDSSSDLLVVADAMGTIVYANPAASTALERADGLAGAPLVGLYAEEAREEVREVTARVLAGGRAASALPLVRGDGGRIPVETRLWRGDWDGAPCLFAASRNLSTEQEALQRFDRIFASSPALMSVNRLPGLEFVAANDAFLTAMGYDRDEVIGRPLGELDMFPDGEDTATMARRIVEAGGVHGMELRVRTRRGRLLDGMFSAEMMEGSDGAPYLLTVMVDVTAQKQAEREIKLLNRRLERRVELRTAQLEAANRELRGFVDSIAHDLRGPLRTIGSFAQILELDHAPVLGDDGRDALGRIVRANARMARLIDALLDLSGLTYQPLRRAEVDLTKVATDVLRELRESQPGRMVEWKVHEGMRAVADPDLARILYDNLLGNAWKFTAGRAPAHIEAGAEDCDGETVFTVRDDGAGFDPAYASRLFRPFERLHDETEFPGVGIGLATVQRIVERHGGRVWAEGAPGAGATFSFTLPAGRQARAPSGR